MNEIKIFNNPQFGEIRTATSETGEPLFVALDVCNALGYSKPRNAVSQHVDPEDALKQGILTNGGIQEMTLINESGVYSLVFGSNLESARQFKKWVTCEVLPAIRKTGGYIVAKEEDTPEIIMARAIIVANDTMERMKAMLEAKEQQIALQSTALRNQAPKVEYHDEVLNSEGLINTTVIAKDLGMSAGALNKQLHKAGIIYRSGDTWVPYSKYQDKGLCRSKTFPYVDSNGKNQTAIHFYWTEKGRELIMSRFAKQVKA